MCIPPPSLDPRPGKLMLRCGKSQRPEGRVLLWSLVVTIRQRSIESLFTGGQVGAPLIFRFSVPLEGKICRVNICSNDITSIKMNGRDLASMQLCLSLRVCCEIFYRVGVALIPAGKGFKGSQSTMPPRVHKKKIPHAYVPPHSIPPPRRAVFSGKDTLHSFRVTSCHV